MPSIDEIRQEYRETLALAKKALSSVQATERERLEIRAARLALDAKQEAKRLAASAARVGKLEEKIEDYTARLKTTGVTE